MRAGRPHGAAALGLCALLAAGAASADYKDAYSRGLEAVRDGDWNEVKRRMQEALAEQATPAARVRLYGQRWEPYVPQYYLGLAAFKQGDCASALREWRSAANAGVIASVPALKAEQDRNLATCESRVAQEAPPAKPPVTPPKEPAKTEPARPVETRPAEPKPEPPKPPPTPIGQRVPGPLIDAYRAWLAGRYAEVMRINPDAYADAKARTQAYLVRAAARHVQAELDGNAEALEAARADVRAVRALDAKLVPDAVMFSPRFRAFYAATR